MNICLIDVAGPIVSAVCFNDGCILLLARVPSGVLLQALGASALLLCDKDITDNH